MGTYHLFFDLDGTLTDPAPGITACLAYAVARLGRAPLSEAELRQYIGPPLRDTFAEILRTRDSQVIEEAVKLYRERFSAVGLYENCVYPGIPRALAHLSTEGFSMSVVTSKPDVYANRIIDHFQLRKFFNRVHGAELSGKRSEKTELVAHALVSEGAQPHRTCMIGDRRLDVAGARTHGLSTVGVAWGYGSAEELRGAGADWVIHTVEELVPVCVESRMSERGEPEELLAEQVAYYRAVAPGYESLSLPGWGGSEVVDALEAFRPTGNVLELACGPGIWTEILAQHATAVTAVDAAPEMIARAKARTRGSRVEFVQANLFSWRPGMRYDVVFFGCWLSHVPPERFAAFWALVDDCLKPGGRVFFVDDAYRTPDELVNGVSSPTIQRRDSRGVPFRIVKVPYRLTELEERLQSMGWRFSVTQSSGKFYWATGTRAIST